MVLPTVICTRHSWSAECRLSGRNRSFIGNIDFQLRFITPLLITAKQLVFVFCKASRLAIMTKDIFKRKNLHKTQYSKIKTVYVLVPLSIFTLQSFPPAILTCKSCLQNRILQKLRLQLPPDDDSWKGRDSRFKI